MRINGRGEEYGVFHLQVQTPIPLLVFLSEQLPIPEERLIELLWLGSVYLNDKRVLIETPSRAHAVGLADLKPGDRIRAHTTPRRYQLMDLSARILIERDDYLVVNKPPGSPVHALTDNLRENLLSDLERLFGKKLYITHRLDIETSGLLLIAKNASSQKRINDLIAGRRVRRLYRAFVDREILPGNYVHFMEPSPRAPKTVSKIRQGAWSECVLQVQACKRIPVTIVSNFFGHPVEEGNYFELSIQLLTGRTQQIRAQLAELGAPILGDNLYGGRTIGRSHLAIGLQAWSVQIEDDQVRVALDE